MKARGIDARALSATRAWATNHEGRVSHVPDASSHLRDSTRHRVSLGPPPHPARYPLSLAYRLIMAKHSPNRRKSIATLGHGPTKGTSHRRRAYSIAPGERISPAAKARRLLVSFHPCITMWSGGIRAPDVRSNEVGGYGKSLHGVRARNLGCLGWTTVSESSAAGLACIISLAVENVACWRCPSYPLDQSHSSLQLYLYKNN